MSVVLPPVILFISLAQNTGLWLINSVHIVNRIMINITFLLGLLRLVWPWVLFNSHGTAEKQLAILHVLQIKCFYNGLCIHTCKDRSIDRTAHHRQTISAFFLIPFCRGSNKTTRGLTAPGSRQKFARLLRSINIIIKCFRLLLIQLSLLTLPSYVNQCGRLVFKATQELSIPPP